MSGRMIPLLAAACASALCACEAPPVFATADERQRTQAGRIEGQVVITGPARGNVVLFLFDAARPPPPEGTGRPLSFSFIPSEKVFGAAASDGAHNGPFTAPFTFDLVPEGRYLVRGFIDRSGCMPSVGCRKPDFLPWYGVTAEPNAGDVGGASVDPVTRKPRVIEVARGEDGRIAAATGVSVSFAESATVPVDRPVFRVEGAKAIDPTRPNLVKLVSEPLKADLVQQTAPAFLLRFVDDDGDGVPDDANGDGMPEVWPKVFVRKLADVTPLLADENDVDRDGILDEEGADYARADGATDGQPDAVVLAAGLRPDTVLPLLMNEDGTPKLTPVPVNTLDLVIRPLALDARDPKAPAALQQMPPGKYAVIVLQFTGQSWRVPNELQPAMADAVGLPAVDSQAFFFEVP